MKKSEIRQQVATAYQACDSKKAEDLVVLELEKGSSAFTDYFLICSGSNPRQLQAISDEVEQQLSRQGVRPNQVEGYNQAEWVLMDYVDFVVHIFSTTARRFYDLERLWKSAQRLTLPELQSKRTAAPRAAKPAAKAPAKAASKTAARKPAARKTAAKKSAPAKKKAAPRKATPAKTKSRKKK